MTWNIIKKQGLQLLRNPQQLLLLIGLPIILITILGTALSSWMNGENPDIRAKVAFVEHSNEKEQVEQFIDGLKETMPSGELESISGNVENLMVIDTLKNDIFGNEEIQEFVELDITNPSMLNQLKEDNTFTAIIEVPENFTYNMLEKIILDKNVEPSLSVLYNDTHQIGGSIVESIVTQFQEQFTLSVFVNKNELDQSVLQMDEDGIIGEVTTINQKNSITSKDYYSIGMAVMNVLFIAATIGSMALYEKKNLVFDRVILAGVSRWVYFIGVFLSGALFGFMQLMIIYLFAWIAFGVTWPNLLAFLVVTVFFSIAVGGVTVLLTALSYRINSEMITNFFSSIIVTIMAFLGGSFYPIGDSLVVIRTMGNFTPNGAGMSAYLSILRGDGLSEISEHILFLLIFAITTIIVAAFSFPKRGAVK
ncbi:ABC transporter permease [Ornithinibacillus sp. L9]|uniref:ABC transporter permease n=1 Tax=Ornithinibacillus caprae TaxID=2678566 RepID=A0A6N8FLG6_9BACI|nr:ABC transporter permease [Ornithinibacillus caprae]MUK88817.1 ABC transporter permease [Ornithinibacillus caprae]